MRRLNARKGVIDSKPPPSEMDPVKLPIRPSTRSNLFSRNPKQTTATRSSCLLLASVAIATAMLLCYLLLLFAGGGSSGGGAAKRYGIVLDGGSTGTRIHVFGYGLDAAGSAAVFDFGKDGLASLRVTPGLSSFAEDPKAAGGSLSELIEFAKGRVPKEQWGNTDIRLMATAGLRLLNSDVQNRILESCRKVLRSSGFKFRDEWASVITGSDEGLYAWVVANHALGTLGGDPLKTIGIIELGGASAQVTFVSNEPVPPEFARPVKFGNVTYNLYSHSFLHYGQNVAYELLKEELASRDSSSEALQKRLTIDPCTPRGYLYNMESSKVSPSSVGEKSIYLSTLQARGNYAECRSAAKIMLQKGQEDCAYRTCNIGSTFTPKLQGKFLATENFFHTSKFFGLGPRAYLSNLMIAGQQFCGEDWSKLKKRYQTFDEEALLQYCFSSAYSVALLHDSLGISLDDESRIRVANKVGSIPLDWALGAFILQSTSELDIRHTKWISALISDGSPTLLSVIFIFAFVVFAVWSLSKWRKPQLKTIYDLEKGRYIVTRISRS